MITRIAVPSSFGFTSYYDNMGKVENIGYELNIKSNLVRTRDWFVGVYGNMAHNKNKILKIANSLKRYNDMVDDYYSDYRGYDAKYAKPFTKYEEGRINNLYLRNEIFGDRSFQRTRSFREKRRDHHVRVGGQRTADIREYLTGYTGGIRNKSPVENLEPFCQFLCMNSGDMLITETIPTLHRERGFI